MEEIEQLKESLVELEDTYYENSVDFPTQDTSSPDINRVQSTVCFGLTWEDFNQIALLSWKAYSDSKREILFSLRSRSEGTITDAKRLITWQIEDIAKEFCRKHGLISDLVKCLEQAQISFSNIENLLAEYDCFHSEDYEEEGHIVIRVKVSSNQDIAFKEYDAFNKWIMENISDSGLENFVVVINRI